MDGRTLIAQAQKQEAAGGGFSWFGASKQDKLEQAIELYAQAANAFRTSGQGAEAGAAFEKAAALSKSINEPNDAANYLNEAFKSYKKSNPADAARTLSQAIDHYALTNVRRAATHKQTLAEHLESDPATKLQAIKEYEKAGEWFSNDNAEALANKCYIKAADISAEVGEYHKAIKHYERIAEASVNNNLMKWSVKEYLFKAALCHLATRDLVAARRAIEMQYPALESAFSPPAMECLFFRNLLECVKNGDPQEFFNNVMQYKERYPLDNWKLDILAKTQNSIEKAIENDEDDTLT